MDMQLEIIKKVSVKGTLLNIKVGNTVLIPTKVAKPSSIRSAITSLNKAGYLFESTEKGLIDTVQVTRNR